MFSGEVEELQAILPFDEEVRKKVEMPLLLRDLIRFMLVVDPVRKPSALSVIESAEFRAFERFVDVEFNQVGRLYAPYYTYYVVRRGSPHFYSRSPI